MRLVGVKPDLRPTSDILSNPDEQRHQRKALQQRHFVPAAEDAVTNFCAPKQHGGEDK